MLSTVHFPTSTISLNAITLYRELESDTLINYSIRTNQLISFSTILEAFEGFIGNLYDIDLEARQYLQNLSMGPGYIHDLESILKNEHIQLMSKKSDPKNLLRSLLRKKISIICLRADSAHIQSEEDLPHVKIIEDTSDPLYLRPKTILHKKIGRRNVYLATSKVMKLVLMTAYNETKYAEYYGEYFDLAQRFASYESAFNLHLEKMRNMNQNSEIQELKQMMIDMRKETSQKMDHVIAQNDNLQSMLGFMTGFLVSFTKDSMRMWNSPSLMLKTLNIHRDKYLEDVNDQNRVIARKNQLAIEAAAAKGPTKGGNPRKARLSKLIAINDTIAMQKMKVRFIVCVFNIETLFGDDQCTYVDIFFRNANYGLVGESLKEILVKDTANYIAFPSIVLGACIHDVNQEVSILKTSKDIIFEEIPSAIDMKWNTKRKRYRYKVPLSVLELHKDTSESDIRSEMIDLIYSQFGKIISNMGQIKVEAHDIKRDAYEFPDDLIKEIDGLEQDFSSKAVLCSQSYLNDFHPRPNNDHTLPKMLRDNYSELTTAQLRWLHDLNHLIDEHGESQRLDRFIESKKFINCARPRDLLQLNDKIIRNEGIQVGQEYYDQLKVITQQEAIMNANSLAELE